MREAFRRVRFLFRSSNAWQIGYNIGYQQGLREGQDFGERVAHNRTLVKELPKILGRYGQLQLRIMYKTPQAIKKELIKFEQKEVERLKMELQDR